MTPLPYLFKKETFLSFFFLLVCLFPKASFGQIQIDSITTAPSNCPNNGSITVYAKNLTSPGNLFYTIQTGPVTEPVQTNNVFNSLPSGNYVVTISDGINNITQPATVAGNYLAPDFAPTTISPFCAGGDDGKVIGNRIAGTGNGPFTWQLIAPSPVTTAPQASDTFSNLSAGNYTVRLTDSCGGFRTIVATVTDPPNATLSSWSEQVEMVDCGSGMANVTVYSTAFRFPLTFIFQTKNGIDTVTTAPGVIQPLGSNIFSLKQLLPNFTYGDYLKVTVKNACGYTLNLPLGYTKNFSFCALPSTNFGNCVNVTKVVFDINQVACTNATNISTAINVPAHYQLVNTVTNRIVDSATLIDNTLGAITGVTTIGLGDTTYTFTITDACGNTFSMPYTVVVPPLPTPVITSMYNNKEGCIDSVASAYINTSSFRSEPYIVLLSGPAGFGSTKPGHNYQGTYTYPDTLAYSSWGGGANSDFGFQLENMGVGKYQFELFDTCGDIMYDSLTVYPSDLVNLTENISYKKGCLGENEIHFAVNTDLGHLLIQNLTTGATVLDKEYINIPTVYDSVMNIPSGTYVFSFTYGQISATEASSKPMDCLTVNDTIIIQGYQTPTITTGNFIKCKGGDYVELVPDSSKGVPPYQYEIIAGPQTFPVQNSNIFPVTMPGTYTARIYDVCGNGSTTQITIDTIAFPPVTRIAPNCNSAKLFYGSSIYDTYKWLKPNGTIFTGDTLSINPITAVDTGFYFIQKIVNINGCTDTFSASYHLSLQVTYNQSFFFCKGVVVHVGTSTYDAPGVYTDTLMKVNALGCDSIVVTSLIAGQKMDTNNITICKGSDVTVGSNVYNTTGFYKDSILNSLGCYDLIFTNLTVTQLGSTLDTTICSLGSIIIGTNVYKKAGTYIDTLASSITGCDSIVVLNLSVIQPTYEVYPDTISEVVCAGDSMTFDGINYYSKPGIYQDTIAVLGRGCQAFAITLNISFDSLTKDSVARAICAGESYAVGTHVYTISGIYYDTLHMAATSCDSIVITNLTVNPYKEDSIVQTICAGQSFSVGTNRGNTHIYTATGIYRDTLATTGCDSIVILNLTVAEYKRDSIVENICAGNSFPFNGNAYTKTGIYRDTLIGLTCDSIAILNLAVSNYKQDSITKSICTGESFLVGSHTYTQPGIYKDTLTTSTCDSIVTLNLIVSSYKRDSVNKSICEGQNFPFNGNAYTQAGIYRDTLIALSGCDSINIVNLSILSKSSSLVDTFICEGHAYLGYSASGTYTITLMNAKGCDSIITLQLTVNPNPSINIHANPAEVDKGGIVQLTTQASFSYLWTSSATINNATSQNPEATVYASSWIYLRATDNTTDCHSIDSVFILVQPDTTISPCGEGVINMPNAFTPNGDGLNDVFRINATNITLNKFQIFNRWGEMVFETSDINKGWDGTYKDEVTAGNYVYWLLYYSGCNTTAKLLKGNVVLIK